MPLKDVSLDIFYEPISVSSFWYFSEDSYFCSIDVLIAILLVPDWYEGLGTEYLIATFGDYFRDIKMYVFSIFLIIAVMYIAEL